MRIVRSLKIAAVAALTVLSFEATPEDIDIFSVDSSNNVQIPNVLFVIDNSANWARQSQQWPEAEVQGQSELSAISQVIQGLDTNFNVGMLEYVTGGTASDEDSGFVRYHIRPMTSSNKAVFTSKLTTIYNAINDPIEKRPQSNPYGKLMWDVYNYLAGTNHSNGGAGTPNTADPDAYQTRYSRFQSPLSSTYDSCRRTVIIFIGNNVSNGPTGDSTLTKDALYNLASGGTALAAGTDTTAGSTAIMQIPFADYAVTQVPGVTSKIGYSACSTSVSACNAVVNAATATGTWCTDQGFDTCSCDSTDTIACPFSHWTVTGTNTTTSTTTVSDSTVNTSNQYTGGTTTCAKNQPSGGCVTPTGTVTTTQANTPSSGQTTTTYTSFTGACTLVSRGDNCGAGNKSTWEPEATKVVRNVVTATTTSTSTTNMGDSAACYADAPTCTSATGGLSCPSGSFNRGCACTAASTSTGCTGGKTKYQQLGIFTVSSAIQTGTYHAAPTGTTTTYMMDEWARYLRQTGVPIPGAVDANGVQSRAQVTTYTIDVFNAQQNADFSALLFNAARVGGGKYFQAKDKQSLINALKQIFNEVQAVNTAFSSASLPVNATNRAQNENQVFIGVFKPDRTKRPLWFGNLKRYQLISSGTAIDLGDANGNRAINTNTGFITDCAVSYWSTDSTYAGVPYWSINRIVDPTPLGGCTTNTTSDLSDSPDGPFVEKGAVSEVLRRGNDPSASPDADGNYVVNRTVYTKTGSTAANSVPPLFTVANSGSASTTGLSDTTVKFIRGEDVLDEDLDNPKARSITEPRSSIHGDVVHSRPQPLNFGGSTGVVVFYGSNDGMYRAVKASTGQELWSFVAPEHYGQLQRLYDNQPLVQYFGDSSGLIAPKDYFFDGSTGVYQTFNADGTSNTAWIYPSMHRGGRKIYAFDVSNPAIPKYMWSKGCDNSSTPVCDAGFDAIGQTWAFPNVAFIKGYCGASTTCDDSLPTPPPRKPVVVLGGGYSRSDDENSRTPSAATRGRGVYILDAQTGTLIKYFDFSAVSGARGIAADVALIDIDADGMMDYAYAADTGGNVYRMDFISDPTGAKTPLASSAWIGSRVAYTSGGYRKFLFTPALVQSGPSTIYLAIGSGDREHPLMAQYPFGTLAAGPGSAVLNRFYVIKDNLLDLNPATSTNLDDTATMANYSSPTTCATAAITPASAQSGWFMDLNAQGQGEQTVTSAVIAAGFVFFSTNRPTPDSTTACSTSLGEARGYFLNLFNASGAIGNTLACGGTRSSTFVGGGLPPSPVLATVPINGVLRTVVIGAVQKTGEPSSPIEAQRVRPPIPSDRKPIYWYKTTGDK